MTTINQVNACNLDSEDALHAEGDRIWHFFRYDHVHGRVFESNLLSEGQIVASASLPMQLSNNILKGNMYRKTVPSSSNPDIQLPDCQWFVDKNQKVIIYSSKVKSPTDLTWVEGGWAIISKPPYWAKRERFSEAFEKVGKFSTMEPNWDSYGSEPINENCISKAIDILNRLIELRENEGVNISAPFIAPLSDGGIQFEWESKLRYLEISISSDLSLNWLAINETIEGESSIEGSLTSLGGLKKLIYLYSYGTSGDFETIHDELIDLLQITDSAL